MADDLNDDPAKLAHTLAKAAPDPGTRWRHYKGGVYESHGGAVIEATLEPAVVYVGTDGCRWVRPVASWYERVTVDGVSVPRFSRVEDAP